MSRKPKRIPKDHREPVDPHLLAKQLELSAAPHSARVYLLVDELGLACVANGVLPGYVQQQARDAMQWFATDARLLDDPRAKPTDKGRTA
jgi:hypothetical protein